MDIDATTTNTAAAATAEDIEQSFLTQFASICTDDKDNLVDQFQYVLNNEPTTATAKFFLDMNNWNLQAAVGCYIDYLSSVRPSMKLLKSCTVGDGESVTPMTSFTLSWLVQNSAETEWPAGTCLREVSTAPLQHIHVQVPQLKYMETTVISVTLTSPPFTGEFVTKWRLCTADSLFFGETIICSVEVSESGTLALTQQLNQLHTSNSTAIALPPAPTPTPFPQIGPMAPADDEMWDDYN